MNTSLNIISLCNCGDATEKSIHYLLRCRLFSVQRAELVNGINKLDSTLQNFSEDQLLTEHLLCGSENSAIKTHSQV